jgi:hypothetical protein
MKVAFGLDLKIDHAVARDLIEHVVEEPDAGSEPGFATAVEIETNLDLGFKGITGDLGLAHGMAV